MPDPVVRPPPFYPEVASWMESLVEASDDAFDTSRIIGDFRGVLEASTAGNTYPAICERKHHENRARYPNVRFSPSVWCPSPHATGVQKRLRHETVDRGDDAQEQGQRLFHRLPQR